MDRNIYDNDFEEFLKQKSDQYKMYPSDRVWNNVYSSLHGRKKWWALGFTLFFIGTGLLIGKQVFVSGVNKVAMQVSQSAETLMVAKPGNNHPQLNTAIQSATPATAVNDVKSAHTASAVNSSLPADVLSAPTANSRSNIQQKHNNLLVAGSDDGSSVVDESAEGNTEKAMVIENNLLPAMPEIRTNPVAPFSIPQKKLIASNQANEKSDKNTVDAERPVNQPDKAAIKSLTTSKWSLQFYASPTISYRRLTNFNKQANTYTPVATGYAGDINRFVHHKPAPGFEVGSNVQYKLSENLTVFGGAQLNYSRYYIDAYKYQTEKASIALNNSMVRDTVSGYTNIRNFSGYAPEQLQNKYLQLSLPVGIEIKLLGNKKLQFSVAGGIQPTFLLSSTSYLISSDYKNYIQSPDLARGFNVHTNFEAFISYKTGGLKWQIGPQFRSQLLSSYSDQYRVREYLTEYGIKFGVTRTF